VKKVPNRRNKDAEQVLDVNKIMSDGEDSAKTAQDEALRKVKTFTVPPTRRQTRYQFFEIDDTKVQSLLEKAEDEFVPVRTNYFMRHFMVLILN
jgi:hypothetical protein